MRTRILLFSIIIAGLCGSLHSQSFDLPNSPRWILDLQGLWRFQAGDRDEWAQPDYDDSSWPLLRSDRDWSTQGYDGYSGMGWYRFHVVVPPNKGELSLLLPHVFTNYELYANGHLFGRFGKMPPDPWLTRHMRPKSIGCRFPLPAQATW